MNRLPSLVVSAVLFSVLLLLAVIAPEFLSGPNFDLADYAQIDMTDYSYEIDGMIDAQVQYLAEDGDLKDWLDSNHEQFEEKVLNVLRTNTIRIEI